jgi:hypothetical protein
MKRPWQTFAAMCLQPQFGDTGVGVTVGGQADDLLVGLDRIPIAA